MTLAAEQNEALRNAARQNGTDPDEEREHRAARRCVQYMDAPRPGVPSTRCSAASMRSASRRRE
jgi:hypothetical protein